LVPFDPIRRLPSKEVQRRNDNPILLASEKMETELETFTDKLHSVRYANL